ncbi:hypothetical protein [Mesorhizobium sp. A556]
MPLGPAISAPVGSSDNYEDICETGRLPDASTASAAAVEAACAATHGEEAAPPKEWIDAACQTKVQSYRHSGFVLSKLDGSHMTKCIIEDWPISRENAIMACGDGTKPSMVVHVDGPLEFGGYTLYPAGSLKVHCG